ncbi:YQGE family putative transporter [Natranaerovirga pectinivora]|uniref:YQGE family putative transporter n=1 Tax=Natranaerovirga pectinivora TaxID=682400 RepID=A0A4R3MN42_9FIRM|nr:MFS transporter [Natranaerovirga pectinivora]TCT15444.1 YQGE family putative transporter [Natranaerovirga pectinivora]
MSKKVIILLVISGLFTLAMGLSNVFVNIFLWKKTNDFVLVAIYNLMHYIFAPVSFILAGWLSKRKNGTWPLRIGISLFILFFILILLFKHDVPNYASLFGILFGLAAGFYWLAFHTLSFDFTSPSNRDTFNGLNGAIAGISSAIAPFSAAFIIDRSEEFIGYSIIFGISLTLFCLLIIISFFFTTEHYGDTLDFKKILSNDNKDWTHIRKSITLWGLRDVVILFLISILIFKTTNSILSLGKLSLFAHILSSLAFVAEQKLIKPKRRWFSFHTGALFLLFSVLGLVFDINMTFIIVFIVIDAISMPFFTVPVVSATFNIIDQSKERSYRTEYIIRREINLCLGRVLSATTLILLLTFISNDRVLNYFLLFIGSAPVLALIFLRKLTIWDRTAKAQK